jgi:hypothetical protein
MSWIVYYPALLLWQGWPADLGDDAIGAAVFALTTAVVVETRIQLRRANTPEDERDPVGRM